MIYYETGRFGFWLLCQCRGSVFPRSAMVASAPAIITVGLRMLLQLVEGQQQLPPIIDIRLYNTFTWVLGFVIVFRTGVAYNRYWEGVNQLQMISTEWFDACAQIIVMSQTSTKPYEEVKKYQNCMVRLFSLLHCCALQKLSVMEDEDFEVLDLKGFPPTLLGFLEEHEDGAKVEIILTWIQRMVHEAIKSGIIPAPPPIVSRVFQELHGGQVALAKMTAITDTPFPFPYTQMITCLLLIHSCMTPLLMGALEQHHVVTGAFAFISVFTLCALNMIAQEIEQPFGEDPNDLDISHAQVTLNENLMLLLKDSTQASPQYTEEIMESLSLKPLSQCLSRKSGMSSANASTISSEPENSLATKLVKKGKGRNGASMAVRSQQTSKVPKTVARHERLSRRSLINSSQSSGRSSTQSQYSSNSNSIKVSIQSNLMTKADATEEAEKILQDTLSPTSHSDGSGGKSDNLKSVVLESRDDSESQSLSFGVKDTGPIDPGFHPNELVAVEGRAALPTSTRNLQCAEDMLAQLLHLAVSSGIAIRSVDASAGFLTRSCHSPPDQIANRQACPRAGTTTPGTDVAALTTPVSV